MININILSNRMFTFFPETSFNDNVVNITEQHCWMQSVMLTSSQTAKRHFRFASNHHPRVAKPVVVSTLFRQQDRPQKVSVSLFSITQCQQPNTPTPFLQIDPSNDIQLATLIQAIATSTDINDHMSSTALFTIFFKSKILMVDLNFDTCPDRITPSFNNGVKYS